MSIAKPRNRLVYFRLSEDEFDRLSRMCEGSGSARSISELSRSAINRMLADQNESSVDKKLDMLAAQVGRLTELLVSRQLVRNEDAMNGLVRAGTGETCETGDCVEVVKP